MVFKTPKPWNEETASASDGDDRIFSRIWLFTRPWNGEFLFDLLPPRSYLYSLTLLAMSEWKYLAVISNNNRINALGDDHNSLMRAADLGQCGHFQSYPSHVGGLPPLHSAKSLGFRLVTEYIVNVPISFPQPDHLLQITVHINNVCKDSTHAQRRDLNYPARSNRM